MLIDKFYAFIGISVQIFKMQCAVRVFRRLGNNEVIILHRRDKITHDLTLLGRWCNF